MNDIIYYGYTIRENPATGRWELYWDQRKLEVEFVKRYEAEAWIDEQIPLNR